ncbi:rod shape-determining protein MreD [Ligilactobacillus hayakitensis]|nr:rod shape-determining protein MreD [Ligilactobacillus hayakitensis]
MNLEKISYLFPIGLIISVFLDGSLTQMFAPHFFTNLTSVESRLMLLWLVMAICYGNVERIYLWSIVAGIIYDLYYTGILGVFTLILPLMVYITQEIFKYFTRSFLVVLLIYLIDITVLTLLDYWANSILGFTSEPLTMLIGRTLGPTLAYNLAWFVVLFIPISSFYREEF